MKKYFFIIGLLAFAFFSASSSLADVLCDDGLTSCAGISDCDCVENLDINGNSYTPSSFTCGPCKNAQGPTGVIDDPETTSAGDVVIKEPCENIPGSSLNNKPHAVLSFTALSCECEKGYGEVDDPAGGSQCLPCNTPGVCCGIKLNTNIPFIGNCIETSSQDDTSQITETTAFPILVSAIVKILISVILVVCFILIVVGGVRIATAGADPSQAAGGRKMIINVVIAIAVLGAIGVILHLINPNFFG